MSDMSEEMRKAVLIRAQQIVIEVSNKNEHNLQDSLQYLALEHAKLEVQLSGIEGKLLSCNQSVSDLRETLIKRYKEQTHNGQV